jgi:hypothetical protein
LHLVLTRRIVDAKTLPEKPIAAHPSHPFPHFLTVLPKLPKELKSAQDVQQCESLVLPWSYLEWGSLLTVPTRNISCESTQLDLRQLPLAATAATLCALSGTEQGTDYASLTSNSRIDAAGYESDGGEEARRMARKKGMRGRRPRWTFPGLVGDGGSTRVR